MKSLKVAALYFKYKTWPEFKDLLFDCLRNFRDAILGVLFLLLCPIIVPFKFFRNLLEFNSVEEDLLDKFLEDPKRWSNKIGQYEKYSL